MEIKLKLENIDYGSLAVALLPLIGDKLRDHGNPAIRLLSELTRMPPVIVRGTIDHLPQNTKDELAILLINHYQERLKTAAVSFAQNQGVSLEISGIEVTAD